MTPYLFEVARKEAAKFALVPIAVLEARLSELNEDFEGSCDIVAEDASEAAVFGDGPCGSGARAAAFRKLSFDLQVMDFAVRDARRVGPFAPDVAEDCPF